MVAADLDRGALTCRPTQQTGRRAALSCRSCPFMRRTGKLESSSSQSVAPLTHAPSEYRARAAWTSLGPRPGQCLAARLRPIALPIAARRAIGSAPAESVGSTGRTAHKSAAECISCGQPGTISSARAADMSSSASRANPSLSSRSSVTMRPSRADTGVRLPYQVGHYGPKIINSFPRRYRRETSQQRLRRPQQAGRFVHRPALARRRWCRPAPSAWRGRRQGPRPKRTAAQPIQPLRDPRQPKPAPLPAGVDARPRQGFLPCQHPSLACPTEPPLSHRARNNDRPHNPHKPVEMARLRNP